MKYPQVEVIWYDGGLQPAKPAGWPAGKNMNDGGGGVIFHGTKDKLDLRMLWERSMATIRP